MKRLSFILIGFAVGAVVAVGIPTESQADGSISCWSRTEAKSYTYTAHGEAYDWGGGWWNNNNTWDSGEGPDCSGLTFKTWALPNSAGSSSKYYWSIGTNIHGPYNSTAFRDGCSGACYDVCGSGTGSACGSSSYSSTIYMDAMAKNGHVAAIYSEGSGGNDSYVNANGIGLGVSLTTRSYRTDAAYDGIRRSGWSSAC